MKDSNTVTNNPSIDPRFLGHPFAQYYICPNISGVFSQLQHTPSQPPTKPSTLKAMPSKQPITYTPTKPYQFQRGSSETRQPHTPYWLHLAMGQHSTPHRRHHRIPKNSAIVTDERVIQQRIRTAHPSHHLHPYAPHRTTRTPHYHTPSTTSPQLVRHRLTQRTPRFWRTRTHRRCGQASTV